MKHLEILLALLAAGCEGSSSDAGQSGGDSGAHDPAANAGASGGSAGVDGGNGGIAGASGATLDCTGAWPEEWRAKEDEALAVVNAVRAEGRMCGEVAYDPAPPLTVDPLLNQIARCFALEQLRDGEDALTGSEADAALYSRVQDSDFEGTLAGWAGSMLGPSIADIVAEMLTEPQRCATFMNPNVSLLGPAYVADPDGYEPHRWVGLMAIPPPDSPPDPTLPEWALEPGPGRRVDRAGVNLSGAEFGVAVPGTLDGNYTYPRVTEVDYFVSKGMNVFRFPFLWERMQRELNGPLDTVELGRLVEIVTAATEAGALAILDPHNYARYDGQLIGSAAVPNVAFADFWSRLAIEFGPNERVAFGLVNEPHDLGDDGTAAWLVSVNAAIAATRDARAENLILVPGDHWTGAAAWTSDIDGTSNATVMPGVVDPADNFVFEVHQYLDWNSSGTLDECVSESIGVERVSAFTEWLRDAGYRGFLGEFGAPATQTCYRAVDNLLTYIGENADVWLGWTWWSAGPMWGDYPTSIEPTHGTEDAPMMTLLERHLTPP